MGEPALLADWRLVTPSWLTDVLRAAGAIDQATSVVTVDATPIGTGQVGANVRFTLRCSGGSGPASVVGKFASDDPDSASIGVATATYETEVRFYTRLAATVDVCCPRCYFAAVEDGTANVVVVMADVSGAHPGDQIAGCTIDDAALAIEQAARLHGPRWGDHRLGDEAWLHRRADLAVVPRLPAIWHGFVERYRSMLDDVTLDQGDRMVAAQAALAARSPGPLTVVHNDFRLDNLLFSAVPGAAPITVVDFQTVTAGRGPVDVAYFLGSAFPDPEVRRGCERDLVAVYHDALLGYGVGGFSADECWTEYRRSSFASLLMAVFASTYVGRTERGDRMFAAMANRSAQLAADVDALAVL